MFEEFQDVVVHTHFFTSCQVNTTQESIVLQIMDRHKDSLNGDHLISEFVRHSKD